jgi:hypothetical protein
MRAHALKEAVAVIEAVGKSPPTPFSCIEIVSACSKPSTSTPRVFPRSRTTFIISNRRPLQRGPSAYVGSTVVLATSKCSSRVVNEEI